MSSPVSIRNSELVTSKRCTIQIFIQNTQAHSTWSSFCVQVQWVPAVQWARYPAYIVC